MKIGRKITGGKYHAQRKKKLYERKNQGRIVVIGDTKKKIFRIRGGNKKTIILKTKIVNLNVKGKIQKTEIKKVIETPQNKFLARQNRLLKGAIIDTPFGKARISNRPSQEGHVNAVLLENKE